MEFFRLKQTSPFMRHALVLNVISGLMFLAAVVFIAVLTAQWQPNEQVS